jgi:glucose-6-phosphate 1-dehydrogenase
MRDMVQNHLMQLLCLIAMEPPSGSSRDAVRDEKLKVIRALDPVEPHRHRARAVRAGGQALLPRGCGNPESRSPKASSR